MLGGLIVFLIGLASFIALSVYIYKELKSDDSKTSKKVLFVFLGILDTFFGSGGELVGFALIISLAAILIGLAMMGVFH
ncbi:hypothetical protein [Neobacillus sp. SuZ13]|uniref:hypothetical protein n=1 Tax=Neobacillus sp. SuZ13 TaxID=3047875 RepID=UPI0024C070F3|nr:hypothetical protein [Neobacillus sp. SuZ13]WHY64437.1 hypothetical protein QNH17_14980 [Neobacillus sp. SuZ13]